MSRSSLLLRPTCWTILTLALAFSTGAEQPSEVEVVRALFAAFNDHDAERMAKLVSEDFELYYMTDGKAELGNPGPRVSAQGDDRVTSEACRRCTPRRRSRWSAAPTWRARRPSAGGMKARTSRSSAWPCTRSGTARSGAPGTTRPSAERLTRAEIEGHDTYFAAAPGRIRYCVPRIRPACPEPGAPARLRHVPRRHRVPRDEHGGHSANGVARRSVAPLAVAASALSRRRVGPQQQRSRERHLAQ